MRASRICVYEIVTDCFNAFLVEHLDDDTTDKTRAADYEDSQLLIPNLLQEISL